MCIIAIVVSIIGSVTVTAGLPVLANHVDGTAVTEQDHWTYFYVGVTLLSVGGFLIIASICGCVLYCQCCHLFLKCCPAKSDPTRPDR